VTGVSRGADQGLGHAIKEHFPFASACPGDGFSALNAVGFRVGLRLGTDESETAHALGRLSPDLEQHIAADGATNEDGVPQGKPIEKGQRVRGKLRHGERVRVGDECEIGDGWIGAEFGGAVGAEVGNDGAQAGKVFVQTLYQREPVNVVEWGGMEKDDWCARTGVDVGEAGSRRDVGFHLDHLRGSDDNRTLAQQIGNS